MRPEPPELRIGLIRKCKPRTIWTGAAKAAVEAAPLLPHSGKYGVLGDPTKGYRLQLDVLRFRRLQ
jgi:hypothetical protein